MSEAKTPPPKSPPPFLVIHSMGKVGSTSLYEALKDEYIAKYKSAARVLQTHQLNAETIRISLASHIWTDEAFTAKSAKVPPHIRDAIRFLDNDHRGCQVICPVRDPFTRNVSAFFNNLHRYGFADPFVDVSSEDLTKRFLQHYPHDLPGRWFDQQVKPVFGVDVYELSLDFTSGGHVIETEDASILLLRVEDPGASRLNVVRSFTGFSDIEIPMHNVGSDKGYSDLYKEFRDSFAATQGSGGSSV